MTRPGNRNSLLAWCDRTLVRLGRRRVLCEDFATLLLPVVLFTAVSFFEPARPGVVVTPGNGDVQAFRLNIQTAPWYEWALLDGIGESRGKRIVTFRRARGGFATVEDLALVPGLPRGWLDAAREHLTVGRESDARPSGDKEL